MIIEESTDQSCFSTENSERLNEIQENNFEGSQIKNVKEEPIETMEVKLKWRRVSFLAFIITLFFTSITFLSVWLIGRKYQFVYLLLDWIFFIEFALFITFGGCIGTWKQSFSINQIKVRLFKEEKITGADTKLAIGSSYTYIFAGILLGIISLIIFIVYQLL